MSENRYEDGVTAVSGTDRFLWWLSTAESELIQDCKVDRNRYRIVGLTVFCTWLFATLAWTYFFSTTVSRVYVFVPMGLFMGFVVLCIDRALIKGIVRSARAGWGPLLLRGVLALTIGLFMAQPAVLYLFDREVKMQVSLDNEARRKTKRLQLDSLYAGQKAELLQEKKYLEQNLAARYNEMLAAQKNYLAETDGTGGSGKVGVSVIALAKKAEFERIERLYSQLQTQSQPRLDTLQRRVVSLEDEIKQQEKQFATLLNSGFLTRIEAMEHLVAGNKAVAFRYYLIVIILMLIELMPVIIKSLLPFGPYEQKVRETEQVELFEVALAAQKMKESLAFLFEKSAQTDKEAANELFAQLSEIQKEEIRKVVNYWQQDAAFPKAGLLRKFRKRLLGTVTNIP